MNDGRYLSRHNCTIEPLIILFIDHAIRLLHVASCSSEFPCVCHRHLFFHCCPKVVNRVLIPLTQTLANHGVSHTLNMSLAGNRTFVIAYAVATSTIIRAPVSEISTSFPSVVVSGILLSGLKPNQPFRLKYLPNLCTPPEIYSLSEKTWVFRISDEAGVDA